MSLSEVVVDIVVPEQEARFRALMQAHHYLGALPKIGETLWYVAHLNGTWLALAVFSAAALKCRARDACPSQSETFLTSPVRAPVAWKIFPQEHRQGRSEFSHRSSSPHAASRLPATPVAATPASLRGTSSNSDNLVMPSEV